MKRVTIHVNQVGLVTVGTQVKRILTRGKHWLRFGERMKLYDLSAPFPTGHDIDVLLLLDGFSDIVQVIDVPDDKLCIMFVHDNFHKVLTAGRHLFWKGLQRPRFQFEDIAGIDIAQTVNRSLLENAAFAPHVRQYKIEASTKGLLFVDGAFVKILEAGTYWWWKNTTVLTVLKTDMRTLALDISGQEILTRDKAQIRLNFSVQYRVDDIEMALLGNKDHEKQLYMIFQLLLRLHVGQLTLDELVDRKSEFGEQLLEASHAKAQVLGVQVLSCGIKDIILPGDVRDIMNQVLIAEKRAQANIIMRREETASTRSLLNTAKLMEENAMLFKLKEMEYVEKIAERINSISLSGNGQFVEQLKQLLVK